MVSALIFAGGTGERMNIKNRPKQFLELHGKAIIIHTIEHFQKHEEVDNIIVVCLESWIDYLQQLVKENKLDKVKWIVPGGKTGQESIYNGLKTLYDVNRNIDDLIVLIHDGVRPLITQKIISDNIECVRKYGSAITTSSAKETVIQIDCNNEIDNVNERSVTKIAKAPQSFYLKDIIKIHELAIKEKKFNMIDSATLMKHYGVNLFTIEGPDENIKITTPYDYYVFKAIYEARENIRI